MTQEPRGKAKHTSSPWYSSRQAFLCKSCKAFLFIDLSSPSFLPRVSPPTQMLPHPSQGCPRRVTQGFCSLEGCPEEWAERESRDEAMRPGIFLCLAPVLSHFGALAGVSPERGLSSGAPEPRTEVAKGGGPEEGQGVWRGRSPQARPPPSYIDRVNKRGERVTYKT